MDSETLKSIFEIGETIGVEFKRCGNGIEADVYESVCSFLNRFGGDIHYRSYPAITFEYVPPSAEEFAARIAKTKQKYPYICAEIDGKIVGPAP